MYIILYILDIIVFIIYYVIHINMLSCEIQKDCCRNVFKMTVCAILIIYIYFIYIYYIYIYIHIYMYITLYINFTCISKT